MHRASQGLPDVFILWQFGVAAKCVSSFQEIVITQFRNEKKEFLHFPPGRRVRGEALDEESHGDDEADAHEEDTVPVGLQKEKG